MIRKITFKGKEYSFRVSYKALRKTKGDLGRDFKSNDKAFDYEGAEALLWHALNVGAEEVDEKLDIKRDQMVDILDQHKNFHLFIDAYSDFFLPPAMGGDG